MWLVLMITSALLFGLWQVVQKKVLQKEHVFDFLLLQTVFELVLLVLLSGRIEFDVPRVFIGLAMTAGLIASVVNFLVLKSIQESEVSAVLPLQNLTPVFLIFIAFIFLSEMPTGLQIFGILTTVAGVYLLNVKSLRNIFVLYQRAKPRYIIYMITAAFLMSFLATIGRYSMSSIDPYTYLFYFVLAMLLGTLAMYAFTQRGAGVIGTLKRSGPITLLAAVLIIGSDITLLTALEDPLCLASIGMAVRRTSTFFSALIGGRLFKEDNLLHKLFACAVMLVGVFLIAIG